MRDLDRAQQPDLGIPFGVIDEFREIRLPDIDRLLREADQVLESRGSRVLLFVPEGGQERYEVKGRGVGFVSGLSVLLRFLGVGAIEKPLPRVSFDLDVPTRLADSDDLVGLVPAERRDLDLLEP